MLVFFAVIGASAGGLRQLPTCWAMMAFLTVMVAVHWAVLATAGTLLGLPREAMLLASNANIGGPATAASRFCLSVGIMGWAPVGGQQLFSGDKTKSLLPLTSTQAWPCQGAGVRWLRRQCWWAAWDTRWGLRPEWR